MTQTPLTHGGFEDPEPASPPERRRLAVAVASAAILLAAADTYVIVLALPAIMVDVGISLDQLQRATPIISGFLLGYVVVMPLLGRLSDIAGRRALFFLCLALFAAGSLVTASAHDLSSVVAGRAVQGLGGGGLVPITLALVADLWPVRRRALPLGVVGAVQELGSVIGPLYGALILTFSAWQTIFWLNLPLCAAFAVGFAFTLPARALQARKRTSLDFVGVVTAALALTAGGLAIAAPDSLRNGDVTGALFVPLAGVAWLTPIVIVAVASAATFVVWELCGVSARRWGDQPLPTSLRRVDWAGAFLLAVSLGAIVASFTAGDPQHGSTLAPESVWLLPLAGAAALLFIWAERRAAVPIIDLQEMRRRQSAGALLVNLAVGAALIAALLDVPILARTTIYRDSQFDAALVLLRLLVAVPIGAVAGGWLCQRWSNRYVASLGMAISTAMFILMSRWTSTTLGDPLGAGWLHPSDPVLFLCGLGFGLAIAPVNASILAAVAASAHGIASALVVVARIIGMLVGVAVLTAVGLHVFYARTSTLPTPIVLCPRTPLNCPDYNVLVTNAIVDELRAVFSGAAVCAAVAAALALFMLDRAPARTPAHALA